MSFETIDLSRVPEPEAIELVEFETLLSAFKARFMASWSASRAKDQTLPAYDTIDLETDTGNIVGQAWTFLRLLDRVRVNDGLRALLAPLAKNTNLDALVACRNIQRKIIVPATETTAAVLEGDVSLLTRFLLSFDTPASGSAGRYLFDARTAWPQTEDRTLGLWDARVNGHAVHGRRGDTDVVIAGPFGRTPTGAELSTVRAAVTHPDRAPEAVAISVMAASRIEYAVSLVIEVSAHGASPELLRQEAIKRVTSAAVARTLIAAEIPAGLFVGAAYGDSIIKVRDAAPVVLSANPYDIPVMTALNVAVEVRT